MNLAMKVIFAAVVVMVAIAAAIYFPPPPDQRCQDGEIKVQERSNGPWYCVAARKLS